jgi:hypothetical protein
MIIFYFIFEILTIKFIDMIEKVIIEDEQEKRQISEIANPFKKGCVKMVSMFAHINTDFNGKITTSVNGSVDFRNGDTEGTQKFKAESLGELLIKIHAFCMKLEEN